MTDWTKLDTTEFVAQTSELRTAGESRDLVVWRDDRRFPARRPERVAVSIRRADRDREEESSSLLGVMGIALIACTLLLVVSLSGTTVIADTWREVRQVLRSDVPLDEAFGKLKFVSSGIAEVFGISQTDLMVPMDGAVLRSVYDPDSGLIELLAQPKCDVAAAADGIVKLASKDEGGFFLEIDHGDGRISRCGAMTALLVEEGQPVKRGDVVGAAGDDGGIFFGLLERGEPIDPTPLFDGAGSNMR